MDYFRRIPGYYFSWHISRYRRRLSRLPSAPDLIFVVFIILRVYILWDNKKSVLRILFAALCITYPSTVIVMVKAARQYIREYYY